MGDKATFGHYRVLQRDDGSPWELGRGARGVTYKALDTDLQRPVALKVINANLVADEDSRERFLREARVAAGLRHSNIASIYQLGKDEEHFFYATEFIEGQTIESYVGRYGPLPPPAALHVAWQLSKALAVAAKQQLVHREIRPAKIIIVADSEERDWPFVKLIDFGLDLSMLHPRDSEDTTPTDSLGSAPSRSSEQFEEGNPDARLDIYSLGCTLWYLLTGEAPFTGLLTGDLARPPGNEAPWACRVWNLLRGEAPVNGSATAALTQQPGGEPPWEKLKPFPRPIRDLLRRMLRTEWQRPTSAIDLQREIEQCSADLARREALAAKIARPLNIGREWLQDASWTRRAAIFGASAMGLALALGYYWSTEPAPQSAPSAPEIQTSDVASAEDPADSDQWPTREPPGWSYLSGWDEPFRSLALAPLLSFAEPVAADPGIIGAKSWLHAASIWDGGVAVQDDLSSGEEASRSSAGLASEQPSAVKGTENKKVAVAAREEKKAAVRKGSTRGKSQVKKPSKRYAYGNYAKKRRVTSRSRDQGFDPLRVVQQARYHIKRAIRRIF